MNQLKRVRHRGWQADRAQRGANLVEFAMVLFILPLLLAAIADFGRAFSSYIVITNAAREGARFAARMEHTESIDAYILGAVVKEAANSGVDLADSDPETAKITIEPDWDIRAAKQPITVTVEYSMTTVFAALVGLDTIPMRSRSVMVMYGSTQLPEPAP